MGAFTPSRIGQINQSGDEKAIFLKKWAGEVLAQFQIINVMMARTFVRTSKDGKSVQWPRFGRASGGYHTPGAEINGRSISHSEIVATIDKLLVSDTFIDKLDDAMNHYEIRSKYTMELARFLANQMDEHIIIEGLKGARLTAVGTELPTGTPINGGTTGDLAFRVDDNFGLTGEVTGGSPAADKETQVDALLSALESASAIFDNNHVPLAGRYALLRPKEYRRIATTVQSNGFSAMSREHGGQGNIADAVVPRFAGFDLLMTTQLPKSDKGSTGLYEFHGGNYEQTVAMLGFNDAIGTGTLLGMNIESEYTTRHQGTLYVASYAVTHKYLRPEALMELRLNTSTY